MDQSIENPVLPAVAIDFETTDASSDAQATEMGFCPIAFSNTGTLNPLAQPVAVRCKPDREITFKAMAITGICPEDVTNEPSHTTIVPQYMPIGAAYIIGHNIDYDVQVAANAGIDVSEYRSICTLAIARELYPDGEHSLGALLYRFDYDEARQYSQNAHSAAFDVRFCVRLLRMFCRDSGIKDMESLYQFSQQARIPKVMPMGRFKGLVIAELNKTQPQRGYLFWAIGNVSDKYLTQACQPVAENCDLECIKGNEIYRKGQIYKIGQFLSEKTLTIIVGDTSYTAHVGEKNIVASFDDINDAVFKAA